MIDLKKARTDAGKTQQELADEIGVTRNHICQIELGKSMPSPTVAQAIGKALGIDWSGFFEPEPER